MTTKELLSLPNVIDLLLDCVCTVDADGKFVYVSAASEQIFGYRPDEMIGQSVITFVYPDDVESTIATSNNVMQGKPTLGFENRYTHKDGSIVHILWTARWDEDQQLRVAVAHNITQSKLAEKKQSAVYAISAAAQETDDLDVLFPKVHQILGKLIPAQNFFIALYDNASDELTFPYFVDEIDSPPGTLPLGSGTLTAHVIVSGKTLRVNGSNKEEILSGPCKLIGKEATEWIGVPLRKDNQVIGAIAIQTYEASTHFTDEDVDFLQFVSTQVASAINRAQLHAHLLYAAGHDPLTGLANRGLFQDRLNGVLSRVRREHARFGLLYLDLDKFKEINDKYGHIVGDQLLQEAAKRLEECVRESDTVARIGGDEFVVLLDTILLQAHASSVARKIQSRLSSPFTIENKTILITPSIGIAVYPEDGDDEFELLRHADESMFKVKHASN